MLSLLERSSVEVKANTKACVSFVLRSLKFIQKLNNNSHTQEKQID